MENKSSKRKKKFLCYYFRLGKNISNFTCHHFSWRKVWFRSVVTLIVILANQQNEVTKQVLFCSILFCSVLKFLGLKLTANSIRFWISSSSELYENPNGSFWISINYATAYGLMSWWQVNCHFLWMLFHWDCQQSSTLDSFNFGHLKHDG